MKVKKDPRHIKRVQALKALFAQSFLEQANTPQLAKNVLKHKDVLDKIINKSAPTWPIEKLNRMDLAILRLAVYELLYKTKTPPKVVIDEAVELAKEYGSDTSPSFVNGALGAAYQILNNE